MPDVLPKKLHVKYKQAKQEDEVFSRSPLPSPHRDVIPRTTHDD